MLSGYLSSQISSSGVVTKFVDLKVIVRRLAEGLNNGGHETQAPRLKEKKKIRGEWL